MNKKLLLSGLFGMAISGASGQFVLVENFNNLVEGELDGQNDWTASADYTVVLDPDDSSNLILQYEFGDQSGAYKALMENAVAEGEAATLFYRIRYDAAGNANTGFSDVADPEIYGDFESQVNRQENNPFRGRDGDQFIPLQADGTMAVADELDVWYSIWIAADNATDTSRIFIQSDDDSDFVTQTEVFPTDGTLNFRNGTTDPLATLMLRSQLGIVVWDDFYVSPGVNLANPAPPSGNNTNEIEITDFQYDPGLSLNLEWRAISGHEYEIRTSSSLSLDSWDALPNRIVANSSTASVELFEPDISSDDGRLFFQVVDLGPSIQ